MSTQPIQVRGRTRPTDILAIDKNRHFLLPLPDSGLDAARPQRTIRSKHWCGNRPSCWKLQTRRKVNRLCMRRSNAPRSRRGHRTAKRLLYLTQFHERTAVRGRHVLAVNGFVPSCGKNSFTRTILGLSCASRPYSSLCGRAACATSHRRAHALRRVDPFGPPFFFFPVSASMMDFLYVVRLRGGT